MYCYLLINFSGVVSDATECRLMTYGELKIQLCKESVPPHRIKATQNFFSIQHARFHQLTNGQRIQQIWILLHYSVRDNLQGLVSEGRCEPFANLKDLPNVITDKWHDINMRQ